MSGERISEDYDVEEPEKLTEAEQNIIAELQKLERNGKLNRVEFAQLLEHLRTYRKILKGARP